MIDISLGILFFGLLPLWIGHFLLLRFCPEHTLPTSLSIGTALALGLCSCACLAGISLLLGTAHWVAPTSAALLGLGLWLRRKTGDRAQTARSAGPAWEIRLSYCLLIGIVLQWAWAVFLSAQQPVCVGDEAVIWANKAKVLYASSPGGTGFALRSDLVNHPDYPLLNPLLQVWSFQCLGFGHYANRVVVQLFGLALILCLFGALTRRTRPGLAALLTLLVVSTQELQLGFDRAMADLMLALGLLLATHHFECFVRDKKGSDWRLTCFGLFLLIGSKNEGLMLGLCWTLSALFLWARSSAAVLPKGRQTLWLSLPAACALTTAGFNRYYELRNDLLDPNVDGSGRGLSARLVDQLPDRFAELSSFFWELLANSQGRWLLLCVFGLTLFRWPAIARSKLLAPTICLLASLGYFSIFAASYHDLHWHLITAGGRVLSHLFPIAALAIASMAFSLPTGQSEVASPRAN